MTDYFLYQLNSQTAPYLLESARFTLGNDNLDDISCAGRGVVSQHITAVFASGLFSLLDVKGPVWLNGALVRRIPLDIPAGAVLSLSKEIHLFYGTADASAPEIPELEALPTKQAPTVPANNKTELLKSIFYYAGVSLVGVILMLVLGWATYHDRKVQQNLEPQVPAIIKEPFSLETFVQELLGENLLHYEETKEKILVVALTDKPAKTKSWQSDIELVYQQGAKPIEYVWLEKNQLAEKMNAKLAKYKPTIEWQEHGLTLSAAALAPDYASLVNQVAILQQEYPWVKISANLKMHKPAPLDVLSVSVSAKNASAVIRKNGQIQLFLEDESVFDAGRLKLVKHNGVVVATPYGDMFVPMKG